MILELREGNFLCVLLKRKAREAPVSRLISVREDGRLGGNMWNK
jgi:hypothetical protein